MRPAPAGSAGTVFQHDSHFGQLVADFIGTGEIPVVPGLFARADELIDNGVIGIPALSQSARQDERGPRLDDKARRRRRQPAGRSDGSDSALPSKRAGRRQSGFQRASRVRGARINDHDRLREPHRDLCAYLRAICRRCQA